MSKEGVETPEDLPESWVDRSTYLRKNTDMTWDEITEQINKEYGDDAPTSRKWIGTKTREKLNSSDETSTENQAEKKETGSKKNEKKNKDDRPKQRDRIAEIEDDEESDMSDIELEMDGKTGKKLPMDPRLIVLFIMWAVAVILLISSI